MRLTHVVLTALLVPAALSAQGGYGGYGGPGGRRGGGAPLGPRNGGLPKFATAKDLEKFNAADAVLNDQRRLKLTEAQVAQLTSLRATLYEKNADILVRYDSVRRNFKPPAALTDSRGPVDDASLPGQQEMIALRDQMLLMMTLGAR
jgi:hypothetical protein